MNKTKYYDYKQTSEALKKISQILIFFNGTIFINSKVLPIYNIKYTNQIFKNINKSLV